ncbi:MAG: primosomal protein N' [Betaproteobacteria bacterium]|jgi:primosomal protein N''|nr:primosomal protein N' [Betaproteobacteria bacterium]
MIVEVILDVPLERSFDYLCDDVVADDCGRCVRVPWGTGQKIGLIRAVKADSTHPQDRLKHVLEIWRHIPALTSSDWGLIEFASRYYHYPLGQTAMGILPPALRRIRGWSPRKTWQSSSMKNVAEPGLLQELNCAQAEILHNLRQSQGYTPHLLYGITGSGKTEIYLNWMDNLLEQGKQVLLLVPEINLTPQFEARLTRRWPTLFWVSLHSGISDTERAHRWLAAQRGEALLVLGTRLAVFTPMPNLGLIIVDEEHDSSFKQQEGLRYSARDLAIVRANRESIPILLGSATPSLESWLNARSGRYRLHRLTQRAVPLARLPAVYFTPVGQSLIWKEALQKTLMRGEQALVFINRRGYAPVLYCPACGWQAFCQRCSTRLVVHRQDQILRCHHCGIVKRLVRHCPECGSLHLETRGDGTQKVETHLKECFPEHRILRLDSDSLSRKGSWSVAYQQILDHEVDLLIGTQLVVKGHDFPDLSFVVVLNADQSLYSSDFRATERLLAQLIQVTGRAGRANLPGQVWIETDYPDHPVYQTLKNQEIEEYWEHELGVRQQTGWPPYSYLAILRAESCDRELLEGFMKQAGEQAHTLAMEGLMVYEPVPALLYRKAGQYRYQILVQADGRVALQEFLGCWRIALVRLKTGKRLRWVLEVDPIDC